MEPLVINQTLTIPVQDLEWRAVRSAGPGGQNVNKVSSKVEMRFHLDASLVLSDSVKNRIRGRAPSRLTPEGDLLITCQEFREQHRNLEEACERLRELIVSCLRPPRQRVATRPTKASKERRVQEKKRSGEIKKQRSSRGNTED